jgi:alkyldihydroxyacetonephosphate synthase
MPERDAGRIRDELARRLGNAVVHWDDATLAEHGHDTWPLSLLRIHLGTLTNRPACVVTPESTEQIRELLRWANREHVPVVPFGGGSGVCGGVLPSADAVVVDLRSLNRLLDLDETALLARAEAGMMGNHFEDALEERGYSMGHFPQSIDVSTVGGWVSTRAAGQFSTRYGSIEDMLAGLEAVLADGRVITVKPTPRRAAGPDLRHLFLGAEGTLGILTELTLRVFPRPESRKLLCFSFPDFDAGLEAIRQIVRAGWRPPVLRLYDTIETGRHFGEWANDESCLLLVVSEGPSSLTPVESEACHRACTGIGGQAVGSRPVEHWLVERNNVPSLEGFIARGFVLDTIEVACGWDRIHDLYRDVLAAVRTVKDLVVVSGHSSHSYAQGTNIYFTFVAQPKDPAEAEATYDACWTRTMEATLRCGGTIAHHHGIGRLRKRWMVAEHGEGLVILRALKKALDPNGILNPGNLLPEGG